MAIITLFKRDKPDFKLAANRRASTRLARRVAITLSGTDTSGRTFREHCYTVVVSRVGAKVETMHDLPVGGELTIENQELGRASKGNVVWTGGQGQSRGPNQVGICLKEAEDFWGLGPATEAPGAIPQPEGGEMDLHGEATSKPPGVAPESGVATDSQAQPEPQAVSAANDLIRQTDPQEVSAPALGPKEESGLPPTDPEPQPDITLQATLTGFATKVQDTVETHSALFEQKLVKAADDVVARTEADLHRLAAGLEEKARAEFTERLGTIETRSKLCEEQLVQVAGDVVARTEANLQGVASSLQERAKNELAERVETIGTRLHETVTQAEAVLPKLHDASRYESEIQKARQSLTELTSGAVEFALEEVNELIADELRPVALNLVAETRQRIAQEGASSLEALLHGEGAGRLHQWFTEGLQAHVSAMEAKFEEALESCHQAAIEKVHAQFESLIMQGAEQARQKCEEVVGQTLEALNKRADEVARGLNERVEQVELRLSGLLAEATSHSEAARATLQQQVDELGNRMLERIQKESGVFVGAACDRVLKANELAEQRREEVVGQTLEAMNRRADEVARGLNEKVEEVELRLSGLLADATSHSETARAALQQQADELGNRVVEKIEKESGVLVDAACDRVLRANELAEQKSVEAAESRIKAMIQGLTESAELHLQAMAEDKGKEFVDLMAHNRERLVAETAAALRAKIAEILTAMLRSDASEALDRSAEAPGLREAELAR